ncbi:unnamed protein product [Caenorhabditis brenneri]
MFIPSNTTLDQILREFENDDNLTHETLGTPVLYATVFIIFLVASLILYFLIYLQSSSFHDRSMSPKAPDWMARVPSSARILHEQEHKKFSIATKNYEPLYAQRNDRRRVEESKPALQKLKRILSKMLAMEVDFPDSTFIISIPMKNFKTESRHGEFFPIHGMAPESWFEYQMIGDQRMQVCYYVVDGMSFVAGLSIYIRDPYQKEIYYSEKVIYKLLNGTNYWSRYNLQEETLTLTRRKTNNEYILIASNRYGDVKYFTHNGNKRQFQSIPPPPSSINAEARMQCQNLKIGICESGFQYILERNGKKFHANWNKDAGKIEYSECDFCNKPDETPPPSYQSMFGDCSNSLL